MVKTEDFPQADKLLQVGMVAVAVAKDNHEDDAIEAYIGLSSSGRQGRYYRHAATLLGLIENHHNHSQLTSLGYEYASLKGEAARIDFLARCLIETEVFKSALKYIFEYKPTINQLRAWFLAFYPGAKGTANRRFSTFISYLRDADLVSENGGSLNIQRFVGGVVLRKVPLTPHMAGRTVTKTVSAAPPISTAGALKIDIEMQKRERANQLHWKLIAAKAEFLLKNGCEPKENEHVDLYVESKKGTIFYEMKSIGEDKKNFLPQIRKAVSQLYEYRYIFGKPDAKIAIVTNEEIPATEKWIADYLSIDRSIAYEWTNDFSNFLCTGQSKSLLDEFSPTT